jgi:hypothetical protein
MRDSCQMETKRFRITSLRIQFIKYIWGIEAYLRDNNKHKFQSNSIDEISTQNNSGSE